MDALYQCKSRRRATDMLFDQLREACATLQARGWLWGWAGGVCPAWENVGQVVLVRCCGPGMLCMPASDGLFILTAPAHARRPPQAEHRVKEAARTDKQLEELHGRWQALKKAAPQVGRGTFEAAAAARCVVPSLPCAATESTCSQRQR